MSIRGDLQSRINPPTARNTSQSFSDANVDDLTSGEMNPANQTDFRDVLSNSMDEIYRQREAIKHGDLSASSEDEFFDRLAEQTKQHNEAKNEMNKDDFLKLFVAQLQHQDPLNPDDGAEMATKLAQFNSLEQMMNMNKTLEGMVQGQNTSRNLQLVNYVGKEVVLEGGRLKLSGGSTQNSQYEIPRAAANSILEIRDSGGTLVFERELGPLEAGDYQLEWDGTNTQGSSLPDGVYTYHIIARDIEGESIPIRMTSRAQITGVDIQSEDGALYSEFGRIDFNNVISVGDPGFTEAKAAKPEPSAAAQAGPSASDQAEAMEAFRQAMADQGKQLETPAHDGSNIKPEDAS